MNLPSVISRVGGSLQYRIRRLRRREFRCYSVGAAKTGTTSIAAVFGAKFRVTHEAEVQRTNRLIIDYLEGNLSEQEARRRLVERDQRLRLELESAHPLVYVSHILADLFDDAKFIVTIREPMSWLKSRIRWDHLVAPPEWREFREYFFSNSKTGVLEIDSALDNFRSFNPEVHLNHYVDHYRRIMNGIPANRRLIVRTSEINDRMGDIARFVGVQEDMVRPAHKNMASKKVNPLADVDETLLRTIVFQHCKGFIEEFFPDTLPEYT